MFVRVVRFTDVTAERVESLVARIDETGPPPGVAIRKLQLVFDEAQGTAVVLQYFDLRPVRRSVRLEPTCPAPVVDMRRRHLHVHPQQLATVR